VCIWPKAPQFTGDEDLVKLRDACRRSGVGAIAVYHLGLLPWRTIERVAKMLRA
jgi:methylmalonyl-CoA mutase cobalamin-binding subunit